MKLVTAAQIREIDRQAIEEFNIPGETLMLNAAEHLAKAAMEHTPPDGCVAVFCGTGNNGGDGIAAAAYLISKGISTRTFLVANLYDELKPDAEKMKTRLLKVGGSLEPYSPSADLVDYIGECNVIIDAIFGIGLKSDLHDEALSAVGIIHSSDALVISADIPSGINADTGAVLGDAVKADITITFTFAKPGHFVEPGCIYTGELRVCDIGIPKNITNKTVSLMYSASQNDIHLPKRRKDTHKGDYGKALILAGSIGYTGAPALAARAATKMGAGLVALGVPKSIYDIMAVKLNEEMPFPLPEDNTGKLIANSAGDILRRANQSEVCLIGPGLGTSDGLSELVSSIILNTSTPIVLDADGLNAIAKNPEVLSQTKAPLVLTPHPGEFVRLGGNFKGDRLKSACDFARKHDCILVLKGHRTIIALPNGIAYVNTTGGPAMAKGGTGDVLAGMITALIAQKIPLVHAVAAAVYIHGLSGDMCAAEFGEYCVTATDIIDMLPKALKMCQGDSTGVQAKRNDKI